MKRPLILTSILLALLICTSCKKEEGQTNSGPLDYAIQVIPTIDEIVPMELIKCMAPYLHFGDNPPRFDTCFFTPAIHLDAMIKHDPTTEYYKEPQLFRYRYTWSFSGQHRSVVDALTFERRFMENYIYENSNADIVYVMGSGNKFTAYYKQTSEQVELIPTSYPTNLTRSESVIVTGKVLTDNKRITGITDFHAGFITESYKDKNSGEVFTQNNDIIGSRLVPAIYDIFLYSCDDTLICDPNFHPFKP